MTHLSPTLADLEFEDAKQLIALLRGSQPLPVIRTMLFNNMTTRQVRDEVLRRASFDTFGAALEQLTCELVRPHAAALWSMWCEQSGTARHRLRTLRQLVRALDQLSETFTPTREES